MILETKYTYPNLKRFSESRLLAGLDNRAEILSAVTDPDRPDRLLPEIERSIFSGTQELINMFNALDIHDPALQIPSLSRTLALKEKVGSLPNLEELNDPREVAFALVNGATRMMDGQTNKESAKQGNPPTREQINHAIGTPSMDIPPKVKVVGTALHFIERTMFARFRNQNTEPSHQTWTKDEILFALEDMAQLNHAKLQLGLAEGSEAILFDLINTPNDQGGLGWRKPANLHAIQSELSNTITR